ncbi:DUF502 domain-containing protein [uncultured Sunxiuqinia sp.]|jgi:uncharacterized membrane protein|uniref:DUF502 domain-containing protein n=1 Tax=uncultured Sunxiuqinia sp. TaxID=1573825 RepID=UPI0030DC3926|tara:strand:+ start:32719 stop:33288 length:570 start_codon:yes stop_codon:yes gene_type:complete
MKKLLTYFMQGLVLVAPIVITIYIVFLIFDFIDGILRNQLESWFGYAIPGLGLLIIVGLITVLGFVGQSIVSSPFKALADQLLKKAPLLQVIYSSLVDLFSAFVGKEKKFNRPVLVEINKENNLWKIGFVTQKSMAEMGMEGLVAVYFPHSYNFSGELYMITASAVKPLEMPPSEAMKFVVSGGVTKVN